MASRLQKKAFYCLRIYGKHSKWINQMKQQQKTCQRRRWFDRWREHFADRNTYNYLCLVQRSLTKKRPQSVKFDMRRVESSGKKAASPMIENRAPSSKSPSPTKRGGILRNQDVFRNLVF